MRIAVLGAGAWGTALAICFARRHEVRLWGREADRMTEMAVQRENRRYLSGCPFPENLRTTADLKAALYEADLAILAAPLAGLRDVLVQYRNLAPELPFLWVCKGLEVGTGLLPHQVVESVMGETGGPPCGVLTGPSFADELARGLPTVVTLASEDGRFALETAERLHGGNLRIYATDDVVGAEIGGAVKNVLAIATGICDGMELGMNARAALVTRGLAEISRLGVAMGGRIETFMGLSGMGDLILTCTGNLSRNRKVGLLLAAGKPLDVIIKELGHVAEGVPAAHEVARRADDLAIEMPIVKVVCAVLDGRLTAEMALNAIMVRDGGSEFRDRSLRQTESIPEAWQD